MLHRKQHPIPIAQETVRDSEPIWTLCIEKNVAPAWNSTPEINAAPRRCIFLSIPSIRSLTSLNTRRKIKIKSIKLRLWDRDSAVGTATDYGLDDRWIGVRVSVGIRIFTSPCRPDWLWGPSSLLSDDYRGPFPGDKAAGA
jgi:hypothetical protein